MQLWHPSDEAAISRALERLFILQDRPFNEQKQAVYLIEIKHSDLPAGAILEAINDLSNKDITHIKPVTIISLAKNKAFQNDVIKFKIPEGCEFCHMTGFVDMVNKDGYSVVLACNCNRGLWYAKQQDMTRWGGKQTQFSDKYGVLKLAWFYDLADIPEASTEEQNLALVASAVGNQSEHETNWEE